MSMITNVIDKFMSMFRRTKLKREIVINVERLETRVAVLENGRLEEYMVEHQEEERLAGSIFRGRVENLEDDLQAAFVNIGLKKNAFLHYWDMTPNCDELLDEVEEDSPRENRDRGGNRRHSRGGRKIKLSTDEIKQKFRKGSEITVMVTKEPISTKGPRVTTNLSIPGRYIVLMPGESGRHVSKKITDGEVRRRIKRDLDRLPLPDGVGIIARTASSEAKGSALARDLRDLISRWNELQTNIKRLQAPCCVYHEPGLIEQVVRDWLTEDVDSILIDDEKTFEEMRDIASRVSRRTRNKLRRYDGPANIFEHTGVDRQLNEAFRRQVHLKCGGYLVIDETEALIAVDVNTGHFKGKGDQEEAILQVNLEAVSEVARQLRLRNIGGLVVLDLIDMKKPKHRKQVYRALRDELKRDRARTNVLEISDLGLLEMSRQRKKQSILSKLSSNCPCCSGSGIVRSPLAISISIQRELHSILRRAEAEKIAVRPVVVVPFEVLKRIRTEDARLYAEIQTRYGIPLKFRSEPHRHPDSYAILNEADKDRQIFLNRPNSPTI